MSAKSDTMAHARTSLDGGDEVEESQHGTFPQAGVGLARLERLHSLRVRFDSIQILLSTLTFLSIPGAKCCALDRVGVYFANIWHFWRREVARLVGWHTLLPTTLRLWTIPLNKVRLVQAECYASTRLASKALAGVRLCWASRCM